MKLRNFISDKGLFQVSGEKTCFFKKLFMALGLPEDKNHRSVWALEVQCFSPRSQSVSLK